MNDSRFPILGTEIPPMLGRSRIMRRIWNDLTKTTPSNLSMIGPRFVGKTVIMNALAQCIANEEYPYEFVLYWHLGHVAPASDEEFITTLCELLRDCLAQSDVDTSEYRKHLEDHSFSNLAEVADFLDEENDVVLRSLTSIIEPVILIVMGALVGLVAVSLFLPLFDLTSMTQGGG